MAISKFLRFFTFAIIPLSILGPAIMSPKFGPIHLLPHWLLIIISLPTLMIVLLKENFVLKFALNIKKDLHIKLYMQFLIFWLFYGLLSIIWSNDQLYGLKMMLIFSIQIVLILLIITNIISLKDLKIILWFFVGILLINYLVAYLELVYNYHLGPALNRLNMFGDSLAIFGVQRAADIDIFTLTKEWRRI